MIVESPKPEDPFGPAVAAEDTDDKNTAPLFMVHA